MPELPEVETTLRGILPHLKHQLIEKVVVRQPQLRWPIDPAIEQLANQQIISCERRGKYIIMNTTKGALIWHLGMYGSMRILNSEIPPEKHDHVDLVLKNNLILRYTDPRRFGACLYTLSNPHAHKLITHLGVEPLSSAFNTEHLYKACKSKQVTIKQLIMNSHIVTGVGNIYACESLFASGINPKRAAGKISKQRISNLVAHIKLILKHAIKQGGTTLKDFTQSDGKPGYFKQQLNVYGRKDQPCPKCKAPIKVITQAQRSTFYCNQCQR